MGFLAPIGFALGVGTAATATTAAVGTTAAAIAGAAALGTAAAGVATAAGAFNKNPKSSVPAVQSPTAPTTDITAVKEAEKQKLRQGRVGKQTLLTGPQGDLSPANVQRKVLLGE